MAIALMVVAVVDIDVPAEFDFALSFMGLVASELIGNRRRVHRPRRYRRIDEFTDEECLSFFRFDTSGLRRLEVVLDLPSFVLTNRSRYTSEEALLILLARLSSPSRWDRLVPLFGGSAGNLAELFNDIISHIDDVFTDRLLHDIGRYAPCFEVWAELIYRRGGAVDNCVLFVDGSLPKIARPGSLFATEFGDACFGSSASLFSSLGAACVYYFG